MAKKLKLYSYYVNLHTPSGKVIDNSPAAVKRAARKYVKTLDINKLIHKIKVFEIKEEYYHLYGVKKPLRRKKKS